MKKYIKNRPNLIVLYTGLKESLFELAINNVYIPNEMDLIRNKQMRESTAIRKKALENNPKLIKYFKKK